MASEAARHAGRDGRGRPAHDRGRHAGRGAHGAGRPRGGVGRPPACWRCLRPPRVVVVRQGQQRWRRARRGPGPAGLGDAGRRSFALEDGDRPSARFARALDRADLLRRRDVRHRVPWRARGRRRVGGRSAGSRGRCPSSRSTSRRASTGSPARSAARAITRGRDRDVRGGEARAACSSPVATLAGAVTVADIGIDVGTVAVGVTEEADVAAWLPRARAEHAQVGGRRRDGRRRHTGMTGAPMLVSHAAMRAGAGIVWCGVPGEAAPRPRARGPRSSRSRCPRPPEGALDAPAARDRAARPRPRFGALVVGPGLGGHERTQAAVTQLVADAPIPRRARRRRAQRAARRPVAAAGAPHDARQPTVLTPHDGEYTRLVGRAAGTDRIDAARRLADAQPRPSSC